MRRSLWKPGKGMRSMRARMTTLSVLFVALWLLMAGMAEWMQEKEGAEERAREILSVAKARAMYEMQEDEAGTDTILGVTREAQGEISVGGLALLVVDVNNRVVWRSRRGVPAWPSVGPDWRVQTLSRGGQTLVLARSWQPAQRELNHLAGTLWRLGLLAVLLTGVGAWFVVGKTLLPIEKLALQARDASTESLRVRLHSPSSDAEMERLTETLNGLLTHLEHEAQLRGRFYAAASHELRTPIQGLLGKLDVARSRSRSAGEYEAVIAGLQGGVERLASLVEDLLQLNALEMGLRQSLSESLNLAFWVERAIEQQSADIQVRGLQMEAHLRDVFVEAPSFHIEMLLRNLMGNAVKYAVAGTPLLVRLDDGAGGAELRIENTADVPEDTDVQQWFEPFFRMDMARSSSADGNGLGLAIVAALAGANGWKVELEYRQGRVVGHVHFLKAP